jgi:tRNA A-37 threonylcarbamoyl transferase component Bud32
VDVSKGHSTQTGALAEGANARPAHMGRRARSSLRLGGGRYRLEGRLFQDPFGTVWDAVGQGTGARLAIQVFEGPLVGTGNARRLLRSRLQATPQIRHPNVALVFDHEVKDKGHAFLTMEPLRGETLSQRLAREGPVRFDEATEIGAALARGLAAAHRRGVTHGGIAPELVFITSEGPKLLGLGIGDLGHGHAGGKSDAMANDVRGLMRLVQMIAASPGGAVGKVALSDDPAVRPSAQELAAALADAGAPVILAEPAERPTLAPPDVLPDEGEQAERARREQAVRTRIEPERTERERVEPARSVIGRALVALAAVILVAAIGIGARALSQTAAAPSSPARPSIVSPPPAFIPATVPDVLGRSVPIAEKRIVAAHLAVGEVVPIAGKLGRIVRTDPTPGEAVTAGAPVTIYVGDTVP